MLTDRISGALQNIMRNLDSTTEAFDRLNNASQNGLDGNGLNEIRGALENINNQYEESETF